MNEGEKLNRMFLYKFMHIFSWFRWGEVVEFVIGIKTWLNEAFESSWAFPTLYVDVFLVHFFDRGETGGFVIFADNCVGVKLMLMVTKCTCWLASKLLKIFRYFLCKRFSINSEMFKKLKNAFRMYPKFLFYLGQAVVSFGWTLNTTKTVTIPGL